MLKIGDHRRRDDQDDGFEHERLPAADAKAAYQSRRLLSHLDFVSRMARNDGFLRSPTRSAQTQKSAVVELSTPDHAPIVLGLTAATRSPPRSSTASSSPTCSDSMVENTRPRNSSATCRSSCDMFSTELTATAARESPMKTSAQPNARASG